MADLPLHLKQLEPLPSALDIIRFLSAQPDAVSTLDDICDGLNISEKRFRKAMRRLVTTGYVQARDDVYELTDKGTTSADELAAYDAEGPGDVQAGPDVIRRQVLLGLPHTLVAGQASPIYVGFPADSHNRFDPPLDVVLRTEVINGDLSHDADELLKLGNDVTRHQLDLTPGAYEQVRIKVQVFQLSASGDDFTRCGGLYVDVDVVADGNEGGLVAYGADVTFQVA